MAFNGTGSNFTALNASNISTGTLAVARGGTGATTLNAAAVIIGNGSSAPTFVAPGSNGNVLVSNGSAWTSAAPAGGGVTSLNGQTGAITNTGTNVIGSYAVAGSGLGTNVGNFTYGATTSGGNINKYAHLYWCGDIGYVVLGNQNITLSGTWRAMGGGVGGGSPAQGLWVRIS